MIRRLLACALVISAVAVPGETATAPAASAARLRLAAAAVQTAGDAWSRFESITGTHDTGLHGGRVTATSGHRLVLAGDELVPGVKVSGTVTVSGSGARTAVTAVLRAQAPGVAGSTVTGFWRLYGGRARAAVTLAAGRGTATGSMPAPEGVPY